MKKLLAVIALFFAFTIGASAQETQKGDIFQLAKKDATELTSVLKLDSEVSERVYQIFIHKHKSLAVNPSDEEKKDLFGRIRKEIKGLLKQEQLVLLEQNSKVFNKLTLN